ncbi:MAG: MFS transporter [Gammaproteobacteria bacterium]
MSPVTSANADVSLLRHRPFRQYWCARVAAGFAYQMLSVAVGWQIYALTHRTLDLGLIGLAQFLPSLLLMLPAGHLADRYERRRILLAAEWLQGLALALLAAGSFLHWLNENVILVLVLVIGIGKAFEFPVRQALLPGLVSPALLPRAMATSASAGQMTIMVGPALGGFLYLAGPGTVYAISACLYFSAAFLFWRMSPLPPPATHEPRTLKTVFAGIGYIRRQPVVLGAISLDLFAVLLGGATALLPAFAHDILHTGPWGLGLLRAAPAVGALSMSVWLARRPLRHSVGKIMFTSVAGFGLATLVFALSTSFLLSLATLCALGAFDMVSVVIRGTLVQLETPDDMRGRVSAVNAMFISTSNQLGEFESGVTAAWFGTVPAVLIGGLGTLAAVGLWMWWFPELLQRERLGSETPV